MKLRNYYFYSLAPVFVADVKKKNPPNYIVDLLK